MSENLFVTEEKISAAGRSVGIGRLNVRLFFGLPLFMRLLPFTLVLIVLASFTPAIFRWYAGKVAAGETSFWMPVLSPHFHRGIDLTASGVMGVVGIAVGSRILAWAFFELSGMWGSLELHRGMVRALGRSRTTFFDENPSGRLINRLVRDYDEVRSTAVIFVGDLLNAAVEIVGVAALAAFASPWAAFLVAPLLYVFFHVQRQRSAMIEHARGFAAVATSQVIGRQTDLIEGREIYLLYGKAQRLLERMRRSFTDYVQASALTNQIESWATFWIRATAELFAFCVLLFLVRALSQGWIDATLAGVVISAMIGINSSIGWLDFSTSMISRSAPHVRRVFDYVDLPSEESEEGSVPAVRISVGSAENLPNRDLTNRSEVMSTTLEFADYTMSYRAETPAILKNLDLRIEGGKKTALIGRTGSGKTSLIQALLRMVHVQGGDIRIGGNSIFAEEIRAHRRRFGVVPQFPHLFAGTIRSNLDRTGELSEAALLRSLEVVGLRYAIDHAIVEGGQNLSLGERQLVCLARVIAAEKQIIVMDEPTSGLDPETDARVSRVLETALAHTTLITIAHRLESLARYDRIVELSAGAVVWQGKPAEHPAWR